MKTKLFVYLITFWSVPPLKKSKGAHQVFLTYNEFQSKKHQGNDNSFQWNFEQWVKATRFLPHFHPFKHNIVFISKVLVKNCPGSFMSEVWNTSHRDQQQFWKIKRFSGEKKLFFGFLLLLLLCICWELEGQLPFTLLLSTTLCH